MAIFDEKIEIRKRCKGVHCVDLGESFPTHIFLQTLASIQRRTSLVKFARPPRTDPPGIIFIPLVVVTAIRCMPVVRPAWTMWSGQRTSGCTRSQLEHVPQSGIQSTPRSHGMVGARHRTQTHATSNSGASTLARLTFIGSRMPVPDGRSPAWIAESARSRIPSSDTSSSCKASVLLRSQVLRAKPGSLRRSPAEKAATTSTRLVEISSYTKDPPNSNIGKGYVSWKLKNVF